MRRRRLSIPNQGLKNLQFLRIVRIVERSIFEFLALRIIFRPRNNTSYLLPVCLIVSFRMSIDLSPCLDFPLAKLKKTFISIFHHFFIWFAPVSLSIQILEDNMIWLFLTLATDRSAFNQVLFSLPEAQRVNLSSTPEAAWNETNRKPENLNTNWGCLGSPTCSKH